MLRRLGKSSDPETGIRVKETPQLLADMEGGCSAVISLRGGRACNGCTVARSSSKIAGAVLIVVLPGARLVHEVLESASLLGSSAPTARLAEAAATAIATLLEAPAVGLDNAAPQLSQRSAPPRRMVILEGLRAAVLAAARSCPAPPNLSAVLPRLLSVVELVALVLDMQAGWRTRIHEARPASATASFVKATARIALEEAQTLCDDSSIGVGSKGGA